MSHLEATLQLAKRMRVRGLTLLVYNRSSLRGGTLITPIKMEQGASAQVCARACTSAVSVFLAFAAYPDFEYELFLNNVIHFGDRCSVSYSRDGRFVEVDLYDD